MKTAAQMVEILTDALATGTTVASVSIDGRTTQYDLKTALELLKYWRRRAYIEAGGNLAIRQRYGSFELDGTSLPYGR